MSSWRDSEAWAAPWRISSAAGVSPCAASIVSIRPIPWARPMARAAQALRAQHDRQCGLRDDEGPERVHRDGPSEGLGSDERLGAIPEISANKYMLWVRFTVQDGDMKPRPYDHDVPFDLALCNF